VSLKVMYSGGVEDGELAYVVEMCDRLLARLGSVGSLALMLRSSHATGVAARVAARGMWLGMGFWRSLWPTPAQALQQESVQ
jgi:hypothetical protein